MSESTTKSNAESSASVVGKARGVHVFSAVDAEGPPADVAFDVEHARSARHDDRALEHVVLGEAIGARVGGGQRRPVGDGPRDVHHRTDLEVGRAALEIDLAGTLEPVE